MPSISATSLMRFIGVVQGDAGTFRLKPIFSRTVLCGLKRIVLKDHGDVASARGRLFTTVLPIRISPPLMLSSPATIRSVVDCRNRMDPRRPRTRHRQSPDRCLDDAKRAIALFQFAQAYEAIHSPKLVIADEFLEKIIAAKKKKSIVYQFYSRADVSFQFSLILRDNFRYAAAARHIGLYRSSHRNLLT